MKNERKPQSDTLAATAQAEIALLQDDALLNDIERFPLFDECTRKQNDRYIMPPEIDHAWLQTCDQLFGCNEYGRRLYKQKECNT